jgi:uncharacterized protein with PIN domain
VELENDLEREFILIIQFGDIVCPKCKARLAQFDDAIILMGRDEFKFKYCPNCGKSINKNTEVI